mmetsp:Transcript_6194/g.26323  ORF Transcript_6194/g.26323 Transcript_6194/m.26323 type:complete len:245 (+) Transcript_6194:795-1529(+)
MKSITRYRHVLSWNAHRLCMMKLVSSKNARDSAFSRTMFSAWSRRNSFFLRITFTQHVAFVRRTFARYTVPDMPTPSSLWNVRSDAAMVERVKTRAQSTSRVSPSLVTVSSRDGAAFSSAKLCVQRIIVAVASRSRRAARRISFSARALRPVGSPALRETLSSYVRRSFATADGKRFGSPTDLGSAAGSSSYAYSDAKDAIARSTSSPSARVNAARSSATVVTSVIATTEAVGAVPSNTETSPK